ncbi:TonB-dependent receptor [Flavobacterium faecale]|uniref:TonB-dependent receptor n=1 Tax=Flavobacterium faecale TaxID=1355330 RepID=A0A2S1LCT8_9FLAO|nr:outer membrane beta-barrel family protein [Flavobacterium faecale]AWG21518.1 TonB-dependent receptor [Flavobacterium faecale]
MKKLHLFLICQFGLLFSMQAQTSTSEIVTEDQVSISGKVIDKGSNQTIPYANVLVKVAGKIIASGVTTDNGTFEIKKISAKSFMVEINFIGYKNFQKEVQVSSGQKTYNLNTIILEEDAIALKSVEIINEKSTIEQKIDRKVVTIGKDLLSMGATAGDLMNNIPSVSVDPQSNAISMRGNSNVKILIDGKPTTMDAAQVLKQIPSTSIKQIELITNPSAKYNPEGMSGIINIILNKNTKVGFNGSISSSFTMGRTPKTNQAFDLNYRSGKFNFYTNYGFNYGQNTNRGRIESSELDKENIQLFNLNSKYTSHLAKIGVDYYINDNNTLSFYTNQGVYQTDNYGQTIVDYKNNTTNIDQLQLFDSNEKSNSPTYNVDFKHKFKKEGHTIELESNISQSNEPEFALYTNLNQVDNSVLNSFSNDIGIDSKNYLTNLDYVNPLTETVKLELGLESRIEKTSNNLLLNTNYQSDFKYDRKIMSAYFTIGKQWKKWSAQAGTRFENYEVDALFKQVATTDSPFTNKLFNMYPSAFLSYTMSDKNTFTINYSRRIDRPSIGQVNPIRQWSTATIDSQGNPFLIPQFTNSFELNYSRKIALGTINSSVFYRIIEDEITRVLYTNPINENKQILSYDNFNTNNAYGVETSANLNFKKWWSANISLDAYMKKVQGTVETTPGNYEFVSLNATNFNARINNTFKASKELQFTLFGMYRGQDLSLQFKNNPMWKMDFGTSYTILKGNGTITARMSDIFNSMKFSFTTDRPYTSAGRFKWESQTAYLGFNYRFGSGKNKAVQRKQRDSNEASSSGGF